MYVISKALTLTLSVIKALTLTLSQRERGLERVVD